MANPTHPDEHDSDEDVEFEDVPFRPAQPQPVSTDGSDLPSEHAGPVSTNMPWVPSLRIPPQRETPLASGSNGETQLRGRLSMAIDRINFRQMKAQMGMDTTNTEPGQSRYTCIQQLADDIEGTADMLWESATPSIQVEGLITLAGILERALGTYPFDPEPTLNILNKLDYFFIALMQGEHPLSHIRLPGADPDHPIVTQTQKVRIRSIAETTRSKLFSMIPEPESRDDEGGSDDDDDWEEPEMPPWMMQATRVYERVLMLLGDQGDPNETGGLEEFE